MVDLEAELVETLRSGLFAMVRFVLVPMGLILFLDAKSSAGSLASVSWLIIQMTFVGVQPAYFEANKAEGRRSVSKTLQHLRSRQSYRQPVRDAEADG
jgi:hypothetical protein